MIFFVVFRTLEEGTRIAICVPNDCFDTQKWIVSLGWRCFSAVAERASRAVDDEW